ncbi:MAG TPA: DUF998 domain-containing protein [Solirubrobacteraceae bacterium]|nr:DUF998 domain-containing protein [Solirubrobacteraceae bacterium]
MRRLGAPAWRLACGAVAGPVFVLTFTAAGRRREGYNPRRHPVSALALGPGGGVQRVNFVITGLLYVAGSTGLKRAATSQFLPRSGPTLIAGTGLGLIGSGIFATDPVSGYPPGTAPQQVPPSRTGALHALGAVPVFLGIPVAAVFSAARSARTGDTRWAAYSAATAVVMIGTAALFGRAFSQKPSLVAAGGLLQRISISSGLAWLTAVHVRAL